MPIPLLRPKHSDCCGSPVRLIFPTALRPEIGIAHLFRNIMYIDFRAVAADATVKRLGNVSGVNLASMGDSGLVAVPGRGRRYQFWQAVLLNAFIFGCFLCVLATFLVRRNPRAHSSTLMRPHSLRCNFSGLFSLYSDLTATETSRFTAIPPERNTALMDTRDSSTARSRSDITPKSG